MIMPDPFYSDWIECESEIFGLKFVTFSRFIVKQLFFHGIGTQFHKSMSCVRCTYSFAFAMRKVYIWFSVFAHLSFVRFVFFLFHSSYVYLSIAIYLHLAQSVSFRQYVCWFAYFHSIYFHFMYLFVSLTLGYIQLLNSVLYWNCDLCFSIFFLSSFYSFVSNRFISFFVSLSFHSLNQFNCFISTLSALPIYLYLSPMWF